MNHLLSLDWFYEIVKTSCGSTKHNTCCINLNNQLRTWCTVIWCLFSSPPCRENLRHVHWTWSVISTRREISLQRGDSRVTSSAAAREQQRRNSRCALFLKVIYQFETGEETLTALGKQWKEESQHLEVWFSTASPHSVSLSLQRISQTLMWWLWRWGGNISSVKSPDTAALSQLPSADFTLQAII